MTFCHRLTNRSLMYVPNFDVNFNTMAAEQRKGESALSHKGKMLNSNYRFDTNLIVSLLRQVHSAPVINSSYNWQLPSLGGNVHPQ